MMQKFDIIFKKQTVGKAQTEKQGLYYYIRCNLWMEKGGIYKIWVTGSNGDKNLGTCVPVNGVYTLSKRIPIKSVGGEILSFRLCMSQEDEENIIVTVSDTQPFAHLNQLRGSKMLKREGSVAIRLAECYSPKEHDNPTGQ